VRKEVKAFKEIQPLVLIEKVKKKQLCQVAKLTCLPRNKF